MARRLLTSPAKGKTTRNQWSKAFAASEVRRGYCVGLRVYWRRGLNVMKGYVTKVTYDASHPAYVRSDDKRTYKPRFDAYCNDKGKLLYRLVASRRVVLSHPGDPDLELKPPPESLYDTLSKNRRAANARDKLRVSANVRKLMRSKSPWLTAAYGTAARSRGTAPWLGAPYESEQLLGAFHEAAPIPPGVFAVGSLMGRHEYATSRGAHGARQWLTKVADYEVRQSTRNLGVVGEWGIYHREHNVRLATFGRNSAGLREALRRMFDIAHIAAEADARDPYREMATIANRMAAGVKKGKRK